MSTKNSTTRSFVLRGYIEQVGNGDFFAICLTTNVCTRGSSLEDADRNLREAVGLYLKSAMKDSDLDKWVPRHAPLYHYLRYLVTDSINRIERGERVLKNHRYFRSADFRHCRLTLLQ